MAHSHRSKTGLLRMLWQSPPSACLHDVNHPVSYLTTSRTSHAVSAAPPQRSAASNIIPQRCPLVSLHSHQRMSPSLAMCRMRKNSVLACCDQTHACSCFKKKELHHVPTRFFTRNPKWDTSEQTPVVDVYVCVPFLHSVTLTCCIGSAFSFFTFQHLKQPLYDNGFVIRRTSPAPVSVSASGLSCTPGKSGLVLYFLCSLLKSEVNPATQLSIISDPLGVAGGFSSETPCFSLPQ